MSIRKLLFPTLASLFCVTAVSGCASFKLKEPPPGFIEVSSSDYGGEANLRMKAPDNVGLNIATFSNRRGGKLPLWSEDLVKKLDQRHYDLVKQSPVKSKNGVVGTRFDFRYMPPGTEDEEAKFYTAVLFVTDEWRVVVQLAGDAELESQHAGDVEGILRELKIRGCKVGEDTCKGPQPRTLSTTSEAKAKVAKPDEGESEDEAEDEAKPEAEAKPEVEAKAEAEPAPEG